MSIRFLKNRETRKRVTSPVGSHFHTPYRWTIKDGEYVYVKDTPVNVYEKIQAEAESVDLEAIIKRYTAGDKDALDRVQTMYFDSIDLPKNYYEMFERVEDMKHIFDSMPLDIKNQFNNNAATFWKKSGSPEFDAVLNDWRSRELSRQALIDDNPVNTAKIDIIKEEVSE